MQMLFHSHVQGDVTISGVCLCIPVLVYLTSVSVVCCGSKAINIYSLPTNAEN